ncbi:endonuclease/exonuclease/phosphatase family protein [Halorientalis halophila]|uniref:endonuclease/exonuclease/phosphatase family protein n=1 Tax=Halorientalis halophila TaxID=3108499 RepID=UPI00300AEF1D
MTRSTGADTSPSRRAVLGGLAGATAAAVAPTTAAATTQEAAATVLTRNVYLGADLSGLFGVLSLDGLRTAVGDLLADLDPDRVATRADAVAAEIAATGADVVALQEAAVLRTQRPGDFGTQGAEPAENVVVDVLAEIEAALEDRGLDYEVAAATVTTDVELPAETDDGRPDVRLTDRDVLLVRDGVAVEATETARFEAALSFPLPWVEGGLSLQRGYCRADLAIEGSSFTAVSTHLESIDGDVRTEQAEELVAALPAEGPVVVGGDFNSGPGGSTGAYDRLTVSLTDAYAERNPDGGGFTCCQASDLGNGESRLDRRIDGLLYRGPLRPTGVERVGHRPDDRIAYGSDGETNQLWPSDHAGVVGTFELDVETGTSTPAGTPTTTAASGAETAGEATTDAMATASTPRTGAGLGVLAALAGIAGGLAGRLRRE